MSKSHTMICCHVPITGAPSCTGTEIDKVMEFEEIDCRHPEGIKGLEMAGLLETDLAEAMDRLEALRGLLAHTEVGERFRRLAEQMVDFDTDQALESAREIAAVLSISLPEEP